MSWSEALSGSRIALSWSIWGFISQLGVLCHGLSEVISGSRSALSWSI